MKLLVISDVHSNIDALEQIWMKEGDSEDILFAGDMVDYGLYPGEVIDWMKYHNVKCVSGNHDRFIRDLALNPSNLYPKSGPYRFADYNVRSLNPEHIKFLDELPNELNLKYDGIDYLIIHSYSYSPNDYAIIESRFQFNSFWSKHSYNETCSGRRRIIFGHTHRSCIHVLSDDTLWLNPGSVSYRREDDPYKGSEYAVIIDGDISLRNIEYPRRKLHEKAHSLPLLPREIAVADFFYG